MSAGGGIPGAASGKRMAETPVSLMINCSSLQRRRQRRREHKLCKEERRRLTSAERPA